MSIEVDEAWVPIFDGVAWKRVLRDGVVLGRIKRLQAGGEGEMTRECFTTEHMVNGQYIAVEGTHATFEAAIERIVLYALMQ